MDETIEDTMSEDIIEAKTELAEQSGTRLWDPYLLIKAGTVIVEPSPRHDEDYDNDLMIVWLVGKYNNEIGSIEDSSCLEFHVERDEKGEYRIDEMKTVECGKIITCHIRSLHDLFIISPESPLAEMIQNYQGPITDHGDSGAAQKIKDALGSEKQKRDYDLMEKLKEAHKTYQSLLHRLKTQE